MAVTIVDQPNTLSPLANGFKFVLNLPDSGDNENVKQGVYQLHDSSGLIKEMGVFRPQGGGDVAIDFKEDIKGKVFAKMPSFGVNGVQNDNTILKTFKILYGEKNIDTVNRVVTTDTSFSSDFKVIAAANNVINSFFIEDETQKILSLRPKNYNMIRNSHDWIWLYGSGSVTYKFYSESGLIGSPLVVSAPYEVNIIPLNLSSLDMLGDDSIVAMEARIQSGSIDETYEIGFATDCGDLTDFIEILFVEPSGSGSVMLFESLDSIGANINQNEILINRNMQTLNNLRAEGGFSISSKSTRGTFSGTKQMSGEKKEISYFLSFASAGQYHIKLYDENESPYWAKFILTSCNFDYKGKTISMSGQLAMPILTSLNP